MAKSWKTRVIQERMDEEIARCASLYLRGRLIDIGCGEKPFRTLIAPRVAEYVGLDRESPFSPDAKPELVGTADAIPAPDASFDCAISTAALEHVPEPELALRECFRVLKPGGHACYTVPFFWHLHAEPWDYFRFTKYGIEHLFRKAGFEIVDVRALSGFWVTWATLFCYWLETQKWMRRKPQRWLHLQKSLGWLAQRFAKLVEKRGRNEQWTWMWSIVGRKPGGAAHGRGGDYGLTT
jgi:ubiquinone/menaquinone biosynthesis C-methylase UbiE